MAKLVQITSKKCCFARKKKSQGPKGCVELMARDPVRLATNVFALMSLYGAVGTRAVNRTVDASGYIVVLGTLK